MICTPSSGGKYIFTKDDDGIDEKGKGTEFFSQNPRVHLDIN